MAVVLVLAVQLVVAMAAFAQPRPARYGWQMYSAVPVNVVGWAVNAGGEREIDLDATLIHTRAEIDRLLLLRERGCELVDAEAIRIELSTGATETVTCQ